MKRALLVLLACLCFLTGCATEIVFEKSTVDDTSFHKIEAVEKVDGGVLYYSSRDILYEKDGSTEKLAENASSLWREGNDIYYTTDNVLYTYSFDTKTEQKLVKKPMTILGKYNGRIISFSGRSIYAIEGTEKTKIFKDGYYLNSAVLYKNKVYGIPATNVYSYDLDTLEVEKVTTEKHDYSHIFMANGELYIRTERRKGDGDKFDYTYRKVTEDGIVTDFTVNGYTSSGFMSAGNDGMFVSAISDDYDAKGSRLMYIKGGKSRTIDKDHYYIMLGIFDGKMLYYKNHSYFGSEQENMSTFYLYDGKSSKAAFDLDPGFFEGIYGYEYDGGILIEVSSESSSRLYNYDGETVTEVDMGSHVYSISNLSVIDGMLYLNYWDSEEDAYNCSTVIPLTEQ